MVYAAVLIDSKQRGRVDFRRQSLLQINLTLLQHHRRLEQHSERWRNDPCNSAYTASPQNTPSTFSHTYNNTAPYTSHKPSVDTQTLSQQSTRKPDKASTSSLLQASASFGDLCPDRRIRRDVQALCIWCRFVWSISCRSECRPRLLCCWSRYCKGGLSSMLRWGLWVARL